MKTIDEIRRHKLKLLAEEYGGQRQLADQIKRSPAQLSQLMTGSKESKTGRRRGMKAETARHIEKCCNKDEGWLDNPADTMPPAKSSQDLQALSEITDSLQRLGKENFPAVKAFLEVLESQLKAQKQIEGD